MSGRINYQITAALTLLLVSILVLFVDTTFINPETPIGYIEKHGQNLRRQFDGNHIWSEMDEDGKLFSNDLIYTGKDTTATLNLHEIVLKVDEQTLMKVVQVNEGELVDLDRGAFSFDFKKSSRKLVLKMKNTNITLSGENANVSIKKENNQIKLVVNSGKINYFSNKSNQEMSSGDTLSLVAAPNGDQEIRARICHQLLRPSPYEEVVLSKGETIQFTWKNLCKNSSNSEPDEKLIEIASDPGFYPVLKVEKIVAVEKGDIDLYPLSAGKLFWRLKADREMSQAFKYFNIDPPSLYGSIKKSNGHELSWESKYGVSYEIQFRGIDETINVDSSSYMVREKHPPFWYRVLAKKGNKKGVWSPWGEVLDSNAASPVAALNTKEATTEGKSIKRKLASQTEVKDVVGVFPEKSILQLEPLSSKRLNISFGLGLTAFSYADDFNSLNQLSITSKIAVKYKIPSESQRFSISGNLFFTAFPLSSNQVQTDTSNGALVLNTVKVRNLGINARVNYLTPWLKNQWRLIMGLGWYYNAIFVTNNYFGYSNVNGPQFNPSLEKEFNNGSVLGSYFKFSPVTDNTGFIKNLENNELASGIYYSFGRKSEFNRWSVSFDYSVLSLNLDQFKINSSSLSLGASFLF